MRDGAIDRFTRIVKRWYPYYYVLLVPATAAFVTLAVDSSLTEHAFDVAAWLFPSHVDGPLFLDDTSANVRNSWIAAFTEPFFTKAIPIAAIAYTGPAVLITAFLVAGLAGAVSAVFLPTDRAEIVVFGTLPIVYWFLAADGRRAPVWLTRWKPALGSSLLVGVTVGLIELHWKVSALGFHPSHLPPLFLHTVNAALIGTTILVTSRHVDGQLTRGIAVGSAILVAILFHLWWNTWFVFYYPFWSAWLDFYHAVL